MCKLIEEMLNETIRETEITITIEVCREFGMDEERIEERIISKFNLSEVEALEYMQKKSA